MAVEDEFENIDMKNLREVLLKIFFGADAEKNKKYVVPLQGNWYNPSQVHNVDNWIGYVIDSIKTDVAVANMMSDGRKYYRSCQTSIHLAFIGKDAELMAQSVLWWCARTDVQSLIDKKYKGVVNNKEFEIYSSLYMQEGLNSTICWNVDFSLQHNMMLDSENPILRNVDISGSLIIGG